MLPPLTSPQLSLPPTSPQTLAKALYNNLKFTSKHTAYQRLIYNRVKTTMSVKTSLDSTSPVTTLTKAFLE